MTQNTYMGRFLARSIELMLQNLCTKDVEAGNFKAVD